MCVSAILKSDLNTDEKRLKVSSSILESNFSEIPPFGRFLR